MEDRSVDQSIVLCSLKDVSPHRSTPAFTHRRQFRGQTCSAAPDAAETNQFHQSTIEQASDCEKLTNSNVNLVYNVISLVHSSTKIHLN